MKNAIIIAYDRMVCEGLRTLVKVLFSDSEVYCVPDSAKNAERYARYWLLNVDDEKTLYRVRLRKG